MKKLFIKNRIIVLLVALIIGLFSAACVVASRNDNNGISSYVTGGIYTAYAEEVQEESEGTLKELKAKVSNDGKYLLLVTAFDDAILKNDGYYHIGYKYTFNGSEIDTTQLEGAKSATYYGAVALNTENGVTNYGAKEIYSNDAYEGYGLIVYEIEFETTYQEEFNLIENLRAFITEYEDNGEGGFNKVETITGNNYQNKDKYRVANGNFDNGLEGWTLTNTLGEKPFAGIDTKETFWGEGYAMNNVGSYFSSYADGADEYSQGNLASPYFIVGSEYATYMLGGAGNRNVYITIENKEGEVLALYRNTKFADFPAGEFSVEDKRAMIGNTVFLANFVTYKVDLSDFAGQEVRFVIHDYASSGWGVVYFDELNTYYASTSLVPENAILAVNELADKTALNAEIALEIAEQGDYTLDSYNLYLAKLADAKALVNDIAVAQETVDQATTALTEARLALAIRPVEEVVDANKQIRLTSGDDKVIT